MKNTISHISRQERRKIERKMAKAKSHIEKNNIMAEFLGISEREFYKLTWCATEVCYADVINALASMMSENRPKRIDLQIFSGLADNNMPLPLPYSSDEVGNYIEAQLRPVKDRDWREIFVNMMQDGYFLPFEVQTNQFLGGAVKAVCEATRGEEHVEKLDIGFIPTSKIASLIPLASGKQTIEDRWSEYLKSDPFGRFGI